MSHLTLAGIDYAILLLYFAFVLGIGAALRRYVRTSEDFFLSGRSIPAWVTGLAFISANLGAQEVIGMGASGLPRAPGARARTGFDAYDGSPDRPEDGPHDEGRCGARQESGAEQGGRTNVLRAPQHRGARCPQPRARRGGHGTALGPESRRSPGRPKGHNGSGQSLFKFDAVPHHPARQRRAWASAACPGAARCVRAIPTRLGVWHGRTSGRQPRAGGAG